MRRYLPRALRNVEFRIDMAHKDPRPINLLNMGGFQIFVYDPSRRAVEKEKPEKVFGLLTRTDGPVQNIHPRSSR